MNPGFRILAMVVALEGGYQLRPLGIVESTPTGQPVEMRRSLQPPFVQSNACPEDREAPPTVRDALGSRARRIVVHQYERQTWSAMTLVADYIERVVMGIPETGSLFRFQMFSEPVRPEIAGSVEFDDGSIRPIEFANGYVHAMGEDGCEWWGRYLGEDRSHWIVRR
jgi:hypothetical protein